MFLNITAAPGALLLAALAGPAFAQTADPPTVLDSVIVTGARNAEDPKVVADARADLSRTPGAVAVVAQESFRDRYALSFADTLRSVPGVFAQRRWGEEVRLSVRGSGIGNASHLRGVLVAQDGAPFNLPDGSGDFQELDPLTARYIEVHKGGNAIRFGGATLGGAINVLTPTGHTADAPNLLRLEAGSFETLRGHLALARVSGPWDLYAAATAASSEGFRDNQDADSRRLTLSLGRQFGADAELRLIVQANDIDQSISSAVSLQDALSRPGQVPADNAELGFARDIKSIRTTLQGKVAVSDGLSFQGAVYFADKDLYHPITIVIDQAYETRGGYGRLDWTGRIGGLRADAFSGVAVRSGTVEALTFVAAGEGRKGALIGDADQDATGLDIFAEGRLFVTERLALVAGGTYGRSTRDFTNNLTPSNSADRTFAWFAPRLGLLWEDETGTQVYANLTRSVEPPTFAALVQSPIPRFVDLKSQQAWTGEIGARGRRGAFTFDISAYRAEVENELLNFIVTADIPASTFNAGDTIHQGIEAGLDWRLLDRSGDRLTLRQTWAWSDFRFDGDRTYGDNRLPVIPEHLYRAELKFSRRGGWFLAPGIEWSPRDTLVDYANTLKAPGYAILNLNAGLDLPGGVSVFLDARNLTDKRYISSVSAVTDARVAAANVFVPGEGRSAYLGVRYAF